MLLGGDYSAQEKWVLGYLRISVQRSWQLSPTALPRATDPRLSAGNSRMTAFPLQEPRVSGCEWHFTCWHFKRVLVSTADSTSPWWIEAPLLFTAEFSMGTSSLPVYSELLSLAWGLGPQLRYPCGTLAITLGAGPVPFVPPSFLPVFTWLLLQILSY